MLHVGFIAKYLSETIVSAFITAAAYYIVTNQIPTVLGIKVQTTTLPFVFIGVNKIFFCMFFFNLSEPFKLINILELYRNI